MNILFPRNQLERLLSNRYYGRNRVTGQRNQLIGMTGDELCERLNADFSETKYIGTDYRGLKYYLLVVRHNINRQYRGYVVKLSQDETVYTIKASDYVQGNTKREMERSVLLLRNELRTRGYINMD